MNSIRQEWPIPGGRLFLLLLTDEPVTPEQIVRYGQIVEVIEASTPFMTPSRGEGDQ